ncbi:MAG: SufD family Fe-S cluster assembly protein [Bacteroidales bacterium]|nr:SufD family Fe-S cluster assembly protein [Bacteroidales bacterium]
MGKIDSSLAELSANLFGESIQFNTLCSLENECQSKIYSFKGKQHVFLYFSSVKQTSYTINVEKNSQISLYSCFSSDSQSEVYINCDENSLCEHYILQLETSSQLITVKQSANSSYNARIFQLNGKQDAIEMYIDKSGENANTYLSGVFFPAENEKYSINTKVTHNKQNCETIELFRGIAEENGKGSFSGLIYVAKGAQKTSAKQQNRNILLSKDAQIHSEPQLEIYADDVVCNHGSSTGQIDEEALWYMQARGIDKITATKLLVSGFANDVLQQISNESLRTHIANYINEKLQK